MWVVPLMFLQLISFVSTASAQSLTSQRDMPFLPGQRMGILQGNNGTPSHSGDYAEGIDFSLTAATEWGMPVVAVSDGIVNVVDSGLADYDTGCTFGNTVVYCNGFHLATDTCERAGHLREAFVKVGERVKKGQVIGLLGTSGWSRGTHLHSQEQDNYDTDFSIPSTYIYKATETGATQYGTWQDCGPSCTSVCDSSAGTPCAISINTGVMGVKAATLNSTNTGAAVDPRTTMDANEGWNKYGWYKVFVPCTDSTADSNVTCSNETLFRKNAYIRRYNGGTWGKTVIVYDVLSGATEPYVVRSGLLMDLTKGWDVLGPASNVGMPVENERTTAYGAEQYFQWGILQWTSSNNTVTVQPYVGDTSDANLTVGPGVFAPGGPRNVHYWNRSVSYRFVDAWNRNGGTATLGQPDSDNGANEGVHEWWLDEERYFLVQNFDGGSYDEAIIVYDPWNEKYAGVDMFDTGSTALPTEGWNRAYVIRTAFWNWYRYEGGIDRLKAPIADEVPIAGGAKQEFLCGKLEYNTSTGVVTSFIPGEGTMAAESPRPGCNLTAPPIPPTSGCYGRNSATDTEKEYRTDSGGSGPIENTIYCSVGPTDTLINITGPIQDGLFAPVTGSTVYLEYGSNTDGWDPYTSGKPKKTWTTDTITNGNPKTYSMYVGANVDEMNFFLYEPATSDLEWFDLSQWRAVGDCYQDGGLVYRIGMSYPEAEGEITCTLTEDDLIVDITGQTQALLVEPYVASPDEIQYGSNTDGWTVPYSSGKVAEPWTGAWSHTIILDPDIYDFNFYLSDVDGIGGEWFDLVDIDGDGDAWTVTGDCWEDGGIITHDPPPVPQVGTIDCDETYPDMIVNINGDIANGLVGTAPTSGTRYLEYGSNAPTPAWVGYTSGKPKKTWTPTNQSYMLILGDNVNGMNWFIYKPTTGQTVWFDLAEWTVTGDCWKSSNLIYH